MYCMNCGTALPDDARFCTNCGTPQQPMSAPAHGADPRRDFRAGVRQPAVKLTPVGGPYQIRFDNRNGEKALIEQINLWLADNPTFGNFGCRFSTGSRIGMLTNHTTLTDVTLDYSEMNGTNPYVYRLEHVVWFGLYAKPAKQVLEDWKQQHPNAVVLNANGSTHSRGDSGSLAFGGIGASNETAVYVFYKEPRSIPGAF